ncbi:NADH-quinone oxidoreductase subunit C [Streptomyces sp. NPDC005962]|uniref:NADH-quinone oxidoreductase subunit C n=1 Tax=Streptomyces sp. NPDC005962 TaxID=3154466 RepID=UPI0033F7EB01
MTEPNEAPEPNEEPEPTGPTESTQEAAVGWLPAPAAELFGEGATAEEAYSLLTVDVPAEAWITALETARDTLGCTYFDWLSAVDEPGQGFRVAAHVVALTPGAAIRRLLVRTTVPHDAAALPTAVAVYAGAAWHERETHEMFGIGFTGHPGLAPLLLPDNFEGHPLRKDFVLAARVAKAWPGAKEPGESEHGGPKRRQMLPPGVPDPNEWGPLKGQLPPAPARPARGARAAGDRPVRRPRPTAPGSAPQQPETAAEATPPPERPARRARSASAGSASQRAAGTTAADAEPGTTAPDASGAASAEQSSRAARSAGEDSAAQRAAAAADTAPATDAPADAGSTAEPTSPEQTPAPERPARRTRSASPGEPTPSEQTSAPERTAADAEPGTTAPDASGPAQADAADERSDGRPSGGPGTRPARRPRSSDAPWHNPRPARDDAEEPGTAPEAPASGREPGADEGQSGTPEQDAAKPDAREQPDAAKPGGDDETTNHPDGPPGGTA